MLKQPQVQRYAHESGLKNLMIAEREVVLTFVLQLLTEKGLLKKLAFKGGTCIRKMFLGTTGRFSTDLDFTCLTDEQPDDLISNSYRHSGIRATLPRRSIHDPRQRLVHSCWWTIVGRQSALPSRMEHGRGQPVRVSGQPSRNTNPRNRGGSTEGPKLFSASALCAG